MASSSQSAGSSSRAGILQLFVSLWAVIILLVSGGCTSTPGLSQPKSEERSWQVSYRYRFGGETIRHNLQGIEAVSEYRRGEIVDQVVFHLASGKDFVLNADILVDYEFSPGSQLEIGVKQNELYHHYDPYLQAEKQEMHRQWVNEQYLKWSGREATYDEWIEALNELTRGVEHHQMERWIQYSPPACAFYMSRQFENTLGRSPSIEEIERFTNALYQGTLYETVEEDIAALAK